MHNKYNVSVSPIETAQIVFMATLMVEGQALSIVGNKRIDSEKRNFSACPLIEKWELAGALKSPIR